MTSELPAGQAVQIISLVENSPGHDVPRRHLKLDRPVIRDITQKALDYPIATIAIAGPARRGKSFMLSYIVRYLTALEKSETPGNGGDWMDKENPNVSLKDKGFKFQNGTEAATEGIWMWSRPFIIPRGQSKIAILLLDTAGCFDSCMSEAEESAIIGLSLLISSNFIFNESTQINQNTLTTLAKFMQYGQLATKMFDAKSFQRITFLVRDWMVPKYAYGPAGGSAFITEYMTPTPRMSKEAVLNRKSIQESFEYLGCYLFPHPGKKVLEMDFTGSIGEMTKEFQLHIEKFTTALIADVVPKRQANSLVNGEGLFSLFTEYVDAFNADDMPSPISIIRANIRSAYESKLSQEVLKYKAGMDKKIGKQFFITDETLQKYHDKYKTLAATNFAQLGEYPPYEQDKKIFEGRLQDEIQRSFLKISQILQDHRLKIVSGAEIIGTNNFENSIKESIGSTFWSRSEFDSLVEKGQELGLKEFFKSCGNPPKFYCEILVPQFLEKLENLKEKYWQELEQRRSEAEVKVNGVSENLNRIYLEDLESQLDEKYANPKTLKLWHQRYSKNALASFIKDIAEFNFLPEFVTKHQNIFENQLETQFSKIEQENEDKLNVIKDQAQSDIDQAVTTFKERSAQILEHVGTASKNGLIELHQEILDMALECLEDCEIDEMPSMYRIYKQNLKDHLKDSLQLSLNALANSYERKKMECQKIIDTAHQSFCQSINLKIGQGDFMDKNEFDLTVQEVQNEVRSNVEKSLQQIDCKDGPLFLSNFDELIGRDIERVANQNEMKKQETESKLERAARKAKQNYCAQIASLSDIDQLERAHSNLRMKAVQTIENCGVRHNQLLKKSKDNLEAELEAELDNKKKVLEVKASQLERFLKETMENCQEEYETTLINTVHENLFLSNKEFDQKQDKLFKEKISQFQHQVQLNHNPPQQQMAKFVDQLKATLKAKKKILKEMSQSNKKEALEGTEKIQNDCFASFNATLDDLGQSPEITKEDFEKKSTILLEETERKFESNWTYPPGSKKDEALAELRRKMHAKFKQVMDNQVAQRLYTGQTLKVAEASLCPEIESHLRNDGFFDPDELDPELKRLFKMAQDQLENDLKDKKINPKESLTQFYTTSQIKFDKLKLQNSNNLKEIKIKVETKMKNFYMEKKPEIKTQLELQNFKEELKNDTFNHVKQWYGGPDVATSEMIKILVAPVEEFYSKIVQEIQQESQIKTEEVLKTTLKTYDVEMKKHMSMGPTPTHPDDLKAYNRRSLEVCLHEAEMEVIMLTEYQRSVITKRIENTFRIIQEQNALIGAQNGNLAIGIDLGTTTSCVAVYQDGKAFVIKNSSGKSLTPSYVYYPADESPIIGKEAKEFAEIEPESTIFDAKRLIGRQFSDPHVKADMKNWPFTVENDNNKPKIVVGDRKYDPEEVSAQVLIHMKKIAQDFFRKPVKDAVITVPANFNDGQRDATRQAAQVAGLNVLQIISEPTAAAIAHALSWKDEERIVLVYDFGGGTFDVSILKTGGVSTSSTASGPSIRKAVTTVEDGESNDSGESEGGLCVLTTLGDTHLGGEDCDGNMINYCVEEFEKVHPVKLMLINSPTGPNSAEAVKRRQRRMRDECERVKRSLTNAETAIISLNAIYSTLDLRVSITRAQFEEMNEELFQKSMDIVRRALEDANIKAHELSDVIMVGGSSRIPRVRQLIEELLGNSSININQDIDIQEAVALGASVQACILSGGESTRNLPRIKDVQPFSLGIKILGGKMSTIIKRNTSIPCEKEGPYVTTYHNQDAVDIDIYSGEERMAARNHKLGSFTLRGIPPGAAGSQGIRVNMKIDANGILNVTATCVANGQRENLVIAEDRGRLTDSQVNEMKARAQGGRA